MTWSPDPDALRGRVAVVAGATRGAGRGIAAALGEAGATVVCTGRTSTTGTLRLRLRPARDDRGDRRARHRARRAPGSRCPSTTSTRPRSARSPTRIDARPRPPRRARERHLGRRGAQGRSGRLGHADLGARPRRRPADPAARDRHAPDHVAPPAPAARATSRVGCVVEVTDGTTAYNADAVPDLGLLRPRQGRGEPARVLPGPRARAARRDRGRAHPGMAALRDDAGGLRRDRGRLARRARHGDRPPAPPDFAHSESPRYVGRAVAALAADPDRARWNQQSVDSGALAREYGFTDVDGSQPDIWPIIEAADRPRRLTVAGRRAVGQIVSDAIPATIITKPSVANAAERANGTWTSSPSRVGPAATRAARALHLGAAGAGGHRPPLDVAPAAQERESVADEQRGTERDHQLPQHLVVEAGRERHAVRVPSP